MSKRKQNDWDTLWNQYSTLLKKWMETFESLQQVGNEIQAKYNEVMLKAASESSEKTLKEFYENWQKTMNDAAVEAFKRLGESWQKNTQESAIKQLQTYGEIMSAFAQTWQKMWRK